MRPRQVIEAISGLMAAMFVVLISSTIVATSMPRIISDLHGTESDYTWVVTATFLAMTVTTPIWGKLADIFNRKLLLQIALVLFVVASAAAGLAGWVGDWWGISGAGWLIGWRFVQGAGVGGLMSLGQVVIADIVSPRERGRYMGIMGAVMAVGQIGGPLLGGLITDSIGWEWNFFVCVPIAVVALILLQATLHLKRHPRKVSVDYLGGVLIAAGMSLLLVWISLGGHESTGGFAWDSGTSLVLGTIACVLTLGAVLWELFGTKEPIIPLRFFAQRTFALASVASVAVGVTMFGTSVFLSQYLQYARGLTPTDSGLATIPMVIGTMVSSVGLGQLISRTGRWKPFVIGGAVVLTGGLALMGTIHYDTSIWLVWVYMFLLGIGTGALMQNLVLVTQNSLPATALGAGSGAVTFFRSLGGTVGIAILGSVLGSTITTKLSDGMSKLFGAPLPASGEDPQAWLAAHPEALQVLQQNPECADTLQSLSAAKSGEVPDIASMCEPVRTVVEGAYGDSIAMLFLLVVPLAVISILCAIFLPNKSLSRKTAAQQIEEELGAEFSALEPVEDGADAAGAASVGADGGALRRE